MMQLPLIYHKYDAKRKTNVSINNDKRNLTPNFC